MASFLNRFPFTLRRRLKDAERRLFDLERAFDQMLLSQSYIKPGWAFNGEEGRRALFSELTQAIPFDVLIETGTYFGDTAGYMHVVTGRPVYTCEVNERFHAVACKRLQLLPDISVRWNDSRRFLVSLTEELRQDRTVFCYLDAHWYADLPLREEGRARGAAVAPRCHDDRRLSGSRRRGLRVR